MLHSKPFENDMPVLNPKLAHRKREEHNVNPAGANGDFTKWKMVIAGSRRAVTVADELKKFHAQPASGPVFLTRQVNRQKVAEDNRIKTDDFLEKLTEIQKGIARFNPFVDYEQKLDPRNFRLHSNYKEPFLLENKTYLWNGLSNPSYHCLVHYT